MRRFLILFFLFATSQLWGQEAAESYTFGLQECIDYALKNQASIKNATLDEEIAKAKVGEVRAAGLPQINGSAGVQHNNPLRKLFLPPYSQFTGGTNTEVIAIGNVFQLPNAADASINITQILFSGSYIVGLQGAKAYRELIQKNAQQNRTQVISSVTKAYYNAVISLERVSIFDVNIARVDSLLKQTTLQYKNGISEKLEVDRIEVTLNNYLTDKQKTLNALEISGIMLKYQMGMPLEKTLMIKDKIADLKIENISFEQSKSDFTNRVEYGVLKTKQKTQLLQLKNTRWSYLPSVVASANLGYFTQNMEFDFWKKNNGWANYGLFQLGLNVPIFDGLSKHHIAQQQKLALLQTENSLKNLEQSISMETKKAEIGFKNSMYALEFQKKNIALSENVTNVTRKKYKQGLGSNFEVVNAENDLKQSQINYYNALYDAIVSKVDYEIAVGGIK